MTSAGIGSGFILRMARVVDNASNNSMAAECRSDTEWTT